MSKQSVVFKVYLSLQIRNKNSKLIRDKYFFSKKAKNLSEVTMFYALRKKFYDMNFSHSMYVSEIDRAIFLRIQKCLNFNCIE